MNTDEPRIPGSAQPVEVRIFGQKYRIFAEEDPDQVRELAEYVDGKMEEIARQTRGVSALKIAILAALNITDELFRAKKQNNYVANSSEKLISLITGAIEG